MTHKIIVQYGQYRLIETPNSDYYWELGNYSSQYFQTLDEALHCPAYWIEWHEDN